MDNTYTYYISLSPSGTSSTNTIESQTFKGTTIITLDFTNVVETVYGALKLQIDWGDNTESIQETEIYKIYSESDEILKIAESGKLNNALRPIQHTYVPTTSAYFTSLTAQCLITFHNFSAGLFYLPIKIAQVSYFEQFGSLDIIDAQLIDTDEHNIFTTIQSELGDLYTVVLKTTS